MHILALILIFVVGSIIAACDGDYSGIAAIGKFVGFFVLLFAVLWLFTQPVLLIIAIIVLVLIVICCSTKQQMQIKYNSVPTLGLAGMKELLLQGKPTLYYIEGIDVTSLFTADRTITIPYGVYEICVLGYTGRVRTNTGNHRYSEGYKASNTLKVVLNKDYPKLKIRIGRDVNSGAGMHLKVQRT